MNKTADTPYCFVYSIVESTNKMNLNRFPNNIPELELDDSAFGIVFW